jgi:Leucine-rich repeat (LRR) protein
VNIPDPVFKARLLIASSTNQTASIQTPTISGQVASYNFIDTNFDGEIQVSEALAIKYLNVTNSQISSLVGIQSFTNLQVLNCSSNVLTSLDLSGLINLQNLYCVGNQLTTLNTNGLTNLIELRCEINQLSTLDVSSLINLKSLKCGNNQLPIFDLLT